LRSSNTTSGVGVLVPVSLVEKIECFDAVGHDVEGVVDATVLEGFLRKPDVTRIVFDE
jgi:hypothetical protein